MAKHTGSAQAEEMEGTGNLNGEERARKFHGAGLVCAGSRRMSGNLSDQ